MEEAYFFDKKHVSWNSPPYQPYDPHYDAYQSNGYGGVCFDYEPQPPYPYEPYPQHFSPPQHTQTTPYHQQTSPWDPNSYSPYHQPYEPLEPSHFEPPPFYSPSENAYPYEHSFQSPPFNQPSSSSQPTIEEALRSIYQEHKEFRDFQRRMEAQLSTIMDLVTCLTTQLSHNNSSTSQTPIDISHEEDEAFEKVDEQEMKVEVQACEEAEVGDNKQELEVEEACKELGFDKQESKGAKTTLTHPLRTSLANLPSNTSFEWVSLPCVNFLDPHQYTLLETDGQLRALCRLKSEEELMVGWQHESKLKNEIISRLEVQGRCKTKINGFQTRNWGSRKHLESWPLQVKHDNQQENGWTLKIWDPGIQFNNQQLWSHPPSPPFTAASLRAVTLTAEPLRSAPPFFFHFFSLVRVLSPSRLSHCRDLFITACDVHPVAVFFNHRLNHHQPLLNLSRWSLIYSSVATHHGTAEASHC
ncbi:hypothetical protein PIB30_014093 [Stylosanthes scabra]|uniref:Uncharacterized protein n=1 Tax=Stylosanthes scabra TaxID=79078 RepID=A0ABU6S637_9FABA|nr:hypothetical protein [Stylosanthes scabra]